MKRQIKALSLLILGLTFLLPSAYAKKKKRRASGKTQVLNFDDELIKGDAQKPELFYLLERRQYNFKKLIRLRENFLPEMQRDAEEINASGRE